MATIASAQSGDWASTSITGDSTNGIPVISENWRTNWELQSNYRIREDTTRMPLLLSWVKEGVIPKNIQLKGTGHDGLDIGASGL